MSSAVNDWVNDRGWLTSAGLRVGWLGRRAQLQSEAQRGRKGAAGQPPEESRLGALNSLGPEQRSGAEAKTRSAAPPFPSQQLSV